MSHDVATSNDAVVAAVQVVPPKTFPELLYDMLMIDGREGGCCEWMYNGKAFKIDKDHPDLDGVIRKYWRHGNLKSLLRQTNTYGFKKGFKNEPYSNATYHPSFQRGKIELLKEIKRRPPPGRVKQQQQQQRQQQQKQGTRKRKIKSQADDDNDSLIGEDGRGNNNNRAAEETYDYDGSDNSTTANDDNSTVGGGDDDDDDDGFEDDTEAMEVDQPRRGRGVPQNVATEGVKVLKLNFKGDVPPPKEQQQQQSTNRILLPYALKRIMMKTWENITTYELIPNLPAPISVRKALELYVEAKVDYTMSKAYDNYDDPKFIRKKKRGWMDLVEGITVFFDKALPTRLLYREELSQLKSIQQQQQQQQQSTDADKGDDNNSDNDNDSSSSSSSSNENNNNNNKFKNKRLSEIYGCEYLLRMLLRLPDILEECVADEDTRKRILQDMVEFVRFLHQHKDVLFATSFRKTVVDIETAAAPKEEDDDDDEMMMMEKD